MQLKFKDEFLPDWATEKHLSGSFPIFFFFCLKTDHLEVLHYDVGAGSSRTIDDDYKYTDTGYDNSYLVRMSKEAFDKGANCVVTGYYNTVDMKWVQYKTFDINGSYDVETNVDIVNDTMRYCYNASFYSKACLLDNLKYLSVNNYFGFLNHHEIGDKVTPLEAYTFLKDAFYLHNVKKDEFGFYILNTEVITSYLTLKEIELNHDNLYNFCNMMRVHMVMNVFCINLETKNIFSFFDPGYENAIGIQNNPSNYAFRFGYHKRFLAVL